MAVAILFMGLAGQAQTASLTETFSTSTPTNWTFYRDSGSYTPQSGVYVSGTGSNWLRLANNNTNESTAAVYNGSFNSTGASVYAQFNFQMYGGSGGTTLGGDGLTFFLYDASKTFSPGAYGGSLGYAQKTGIDGLNGGYIGVGLDAFGNFSAASEGRVGGLNGTTSAVTESIAVRGPGQGQSGYAYLGGTTANLGTGSTIDTSTATSTNATVQILLSATNQLTVTLALGSSTPQTVLQMDLSGYARPDLLSFGFTAGTGDATDNILVNGLSVSTVTANKWTSNGGDGNWSNNLNWNPATVPSNGSDLLFDNTYVSSSQVINTMAGRSVRSISFDAPFSYTLNNNTITIDNGNTPGFTGIAVSQTHGAGDFTINSNLALNDAIYVRNNASGSLTVNGAIANNGNAITFDGKGANTVVNGAISGSGAVLKNDTGTVTLAGTNSYTGGTTINNGTLNANSSNALGSAGAAVTLAGGTLGSTNNSSINANITLTGNAGMSGITNAGTLTQSGANRTLTLSSVTQSGTVSLSNNSTNRNLTLQVDSGTSTISGSIVDGSTSTASGITKTGSGTLVLSGSNTYRGATTISNGVLQLGANNVLSNSTNVRIDSSGTLNLNGFSDKVGTLTALNGGATIDFGTQGTSNGLVFGTYQAPSSGVLVVNNWESSRDYLGTTVSGQTVNTVYFSGYGIATLDTSLTSLSSLGLGNAYLLKPGAQNTTTWAGTTSSWNTGKNWSGKATPTTGQVAVFADTGATAVTLDSSPTIAGIQFAANAQSYTISGSNTLTLSGTIPYIQQKSANLETFSANLNLAANSVIDMIGSGNLLLSGNISGSKNLVKDGTGSGKLILSGNNSSYTGDIYVNTGILQAGSTTALGSTSSSAVSVAQGATLELAANGTIANAISVIGTGTGDAGALHNVTGNNTLSGTVTQTGATTIAADANTALTISGNLTGTNTNTTLAGAGNITLSQISTGTAGVTVNSTGTVTFNGSTANGYTGDTIVNSGTLSLAKTAGTTSIAGNLIVNGGSVELAANNQVSDTSTVTLNGAGRFDLNGKTETIAQLSSTSATAAVDLGAGSLSINAVNNQNSTYTGTIAGTSASSLNVTGTGKVYLSGNNSGFAGTINVNSGTLNASGSNSALGTANVSIASGGNFQVQGGVSLANTITASGLGTSGNGAIENFAGNNTLSGAVSLAGNTLVQADAGSLTLSGAVSLGSYALTVGGPANTTLSGQVSGTGSVTKTSAGTLTMSGTSTYSGGTSINSGALIAAGNSALGSGAVAVANGAALQVQGDSALSNSVSIAGTGISGTGAIRNLSGSNSISGAVTLSTSSRIQSDAGTLSLGSIAQGTNALAIGGSGNTTVTGAISGSGSLTKDGSGTVTLSSANTFTGATSVSGGTLALNATNALGSTSSVSVTSGSLAINASNAIRASGSLTVSSGANVSLAPSISQTVAGLTAASGSSINLGANATLNVSTSSLTSIGGLAGTGTLAVSGGGNLTLNNTANFGGTLEFGGTTKGGTPTATLTFAPGTTTIGTLHITGDTILDFGNSSSTILNVNNLIIDQGATLRVVNWVNLTDYFYAYAFSSKNTSTGTLTPASPNSPGTAPSNQIGFSGYNNNNTAWLSYDHQITPAPEPGAYGAIFIGATLGCFGLYRWRRRHAR